MNKWEKYYNFLHVCIVSTRLIGFETNGNRIHIWIKLFHWKKILELRTVEKKHNMYTCQGLFTTKLLLKCWRYWKAPDCILIARRWKLKNQSGTSPVFFWYFKRYLLVNRPCYKRIFKKYSIVLYAFLSIN